MTDTMTESPTVRLQIAHPDPHSRPEPATRTPSPESLVWQNAKTVLVTRVAGDRHLITVPRLVIPIGEAGIAFRVSSNSAEAEQLEQDSRVLVQPADWRGNPILGTHQRQGRTQIVTAGTLLAHVQSETESKYRWRLSLARLGHRLAHRGTPYGDIIALVTVFEPSPIPLPAPTTA
ncbi:hypothetical protein [Nocardia jejuensis]|uniref:hypothetical protein n=1 Tax=Nocardia jejuensis TaxID=328049 RepID=UPI00082DFB6C|nr:hypothetical protein [Nocardia jejuensis]